MFMAALFRIAQRGEQLISIDGWMDEQCGISMQFNYSGIKRNEALTRATTWINPENVMLRGKAGHKTPHGVRLRL